MVDIQMKFDGCIGILWVDLETTGVDEYKDDIIEIGAILTDMNWNPFGREYEFSMVIEPGALGLGRMIKTPVVYEMHQKNGLLDECLNSPTRAPDIKSAEQDMLRWMNYTLNDKRRRGPVEKFKFMLGGSGVHHFDRRFINEHMPALAKCLSRKPVDTSPMRDWLRLSGFDPSSLALTETKNHRALDDIRLHMQEGAAYRKMLSEAFGGASNPSPHELTRK